MNSLFYEEVKMSVYAIWNNKGGVGKSYLTFQIAAEYARIHRDQNVLVIDLCPQANSSCMLMGGIKNGEAYLEDLAGQLPAKTISGYIADRIMSPYVDPKSGSNFVINVSLYNEHIPKNLYLVCGDEGLEIQASNILAACGPSGPTNAWQIVHTWIRNLIEDIKTSWNQDNITVFIDCNPSFTIYTELAISASNRLIIPFSADGSSKRAVRSVLSLIYGVQRRPGQARSKFYIQSDSYRMALPKIYSYVGNRLTQMNSSSATAFKTVVRAIRDEIVGVYNQDPGRFEIHPQGQQAPKTISEFRKMFEAEINDANSASVVSGALGIPINKLTAGTKKMIGRSVQVNQSQLDKQQSNLKAFVESIE